MDLERKLGDAVADGRIDAEDGDKVRTFSLYLTELSRELGYVHVGPLRERWKRCSPEFRARWGPYLAGRADGPTER